MEVEVSYSLESADQFWAELDDILTAPCPTHEAIDDTLRSYLAFTTTFKESYLRTDTDIARSASHLLSSPLFAHHAEYVRRQFVYGLLQEDDAAVLHVIAAVLLYDGRGHEDTYEMMQAEGAFPRLVELVQGWGADGVLHRVLLELLYDMARMQRLVWEDLASINDTFVLYLFRIIESASDDARDPYHYPVIRVLLVLNEQYMVSSALHPQSAHPLTNRVLKALSTNISEYKTFGENIILLLNREVETSPQLLILKLLYLLFSTKATAEYFYTNDLHVLLDVILRNLLDLPADLEPATPNGLDPSHSTTPTTPSDPMQALRHTYLRVLFPLLANSQLARPGMAYKPADVCQVLRLLCGGHASGGGSHFAPADRTTIRLVERCRSVPWLGYAPDLDHDHNHDGGSVATAANEEGQLDSSSPIHARGDGYAAVAQRSLGMSVENGGESVLSVLAVAAHTERPGIITPSLGLGGGAGEGSGGGRAGGDRLV